MTNLEYIKDMLLDERAFAEMYMHRNGNAEQKIFDAYNKWALKFGDHKGNCVCDAGKPSVWAYQLWHYPDGHKETNGRSYSVSLQVWLGKQYDPEDWKNFTPESQED